MRRYLFASSLSLAFVLGTPTAANAQRVNAPATVPSEQPLLHVQADPLTGKIVATFPKPAADGVSARYIYLTQLETGLGSAPIGLDRAAASETRILVFRRIGKKVAAEVENSKFVASSGDPDEKRMLSIARLRRRPCGWATCSTMRRTAHFRSISPVSSRATTSASRWRSRMAAEAIQVRARTQRCRSRFREGLSKKCRVCGEDDLPFGRAKARGHQYRRGNTLTLVLRHSLIALPEPGYVPRTDPYGYTIGHQKVDFSTPLGAPVVGDLARRFRLEKIDPAAARSPVKKPIVFYIDRSAPEPIRTALKEGVSWWTRHSNIRFRERVQGRRASRRR